ncbi:MAG: hypothetical protein AAGD10_11015 [Myxococcota bacterium]
MDSTREHKKVDVELVGAERRAYYRELLDQLRAIEQLEADDAFEQSVWRMGSEQKVSMTSRAIEVSISSPPTSMSEDLPSE